ncbi:MAG: formylglycine-generating enzyme family protein, partial [Verrucomicrobiota bacterium]
YKERPVTWVRLTQSFWLGRTEVTQAQWAAVMGSNPSYFKGDELPVEQVSWDDAIEFCRKLTERERAAGRLPAGYTFTLPTEAQWEYACRAGTTGDYAGDIGVMAWTIENSGGTTHQVGRKQANGWGLSDMSGNVWEWCLDWVGDYRGGEVTNPRGPPSGSERVTRGGGWGYDAAGGRSAIRHGDEPGVRYFYNGFRLALSAVR